jgi:hypothetical protein
MDTVRTLAVINNIQTIDSNKDLIQFENLHRNAVSYLRFMGALLTVPLSSNGYLACFG